MIFWSVIECRRLDQERFKWFVFNDERTFMSLQKSNQEEVHQKESRQAHPASRKTLHYTKWDPQFMGGFKMSYKISRLHKNQKFSNGISIKKHIRKSEKITCLRRARRPRRPPAARQPKGQEVNIIPSLVIYNARHPQDGDQIGDQQNFRKYNFRKSKKKDLKLRIDETALQTWSQLSIVPKFTLNKLWVIPECFIKCRTERMKKYLWTNNWYFHSRYSTLIPGNEHNVFHFVQLIKRNMKRWVNWYSVKLSLSFRT